MVWSDPEIQRLSKEFVPVTEEAYYMYPENPQHRERASSREDFQFFKKFGESMPRGEWNSGTKQGVYMMGPNAEYLEGKFAASGDAADIRSRLQRAISAWNKLKKEKSYAEKPIPSVSFGPPPGTAGELVFRVNVRDLPRGPGDKSGARRHELAESGMWLDFVKWAWNENWIGLPNAKVFVPSSDTWQDINQATVERIVREVFVDNVRGQAPPWQPHEVRQVKLGMKRVSAGEFHYSGSFSLGSGGRGFDGKIFGKGIWNSGMQKFTKLDLVAMGTRRGAARFNQRESDLGPAPMGVTLSLSLK